jgi:hypothetical protein
VLGEDGVPKRIDSFAMAIQARLTIYDLEEAELSYAPPYGSAKDPVNFAGMVAADVLRGDMPLSHWSSLDGEFLLDVRNPPELAVECVPGAVNIPLPELRARLGELPPRSRDLRHLPLCPAGLLCDADPAAERVQGPKHLGRHAVAFDASARMKQMDQRLQSAKKEERIDMGKHTLPRGVPRAASRSVAITSRTGGQR